MTPILHDEQQPLRVALDDIIAAHGRWRVLLALFAQPELRAPRPVPHLGLNDHLRRDIGLGPLPPPRDCLLQARPGPSHPLAGRGGGR